MSTLCLVIRMEVISPIVCFVGNMTKEETFNKLVVCSFDMYSVLRIHVSVDWVIVDQMDKRDRNSSDIQ